MPPGSPATTVSVTRDIAADADAVWTMVSDLPRMGEWSPENTGGRWVGSATGPAKGARFRGKNRLGRRGWSTLAVVSSCVPGRLFEFDVTAVGLKVARWGYSLEPTHDGCRVTETFTDMRSPVVRLLGTPISGVSDRATHNRATMETTLENLARSAEAQGH